VPTERGNAPSSSSTGNGHASTSALWLLVSCAWSIGSTLAAQSGQRGVTGKAAAPDQATRRTGDELAHTLPHEAGVSVLSGSAFGSVGRNHIPLSYADSQDQVRRAIEKMRAVLEAVPAGR